MWKEQLTPNHFTDADCHTSVKICCKFTYVCTNNQPESVGLDIATRKRK